MSRWVAGATFPSSSKATSSGGSMGSAAAMRGAGLVLLEMQLGAGEKLSFFLGCQEETRLPSLLVLPCTRTETDKKTTELRGLGSFTQSQ